jgi:hypothetical protein
LGAGEGDAAPRTESEGDSSSNTTTSSPITSNTSTYPVSTISSDAQQPRAQPDHPCDRSKQASSSSFDPLFQSLNATTPFVGDLAKPGAMEEMLANRSFQGEIIGFYTNCCVFARAHTHLTPHPARLPLCRNA